MRLLLLTGILLLLLSCKPKNGFDCDTFLSTEIGLTTPPEEVVKECQKLANCGIDSFDVKFIKPSLIKGLREGANKRNEKFTYGYILEKMKRAIDNSEYYQKEKAEME